VTHVCHAVGCVVEVPPRLLMCARHWRMVPAPLQRAVWAAYVPGQEIRKDPTSAYLRVAADAIAAVLALELERPAEPAQVDLFATGRRGGKTAALREIAGPDATIVGPSKPADPFDTDDGP
jgi:hypothetical protein